MLQNNFNPHANLCFLLHFPLIVIVGPVSLSDCRRSLQLLLIFLLWDLAQGSTAVSIFQRSSLAWISKFHESTCTSNHSQYDLYHVYIKIYHLKVYFAFNQFLNTFRLSPGIIELKEIICEDLPIIRGMYYVNIEKLIDRNILVILCTTESAVQSTWHC